MSYYKYCLIRTITSERLSNLIDAHKWYEQEPTLSNVQLLHTASRAKSLSCNDIVELATAIIRQSDRLTTSDTAEVATAILNACTERIEGGFRKENPCSIVRHGFLYYAFVSDNCALSCSFSFCNCSYA